jgi:hypothetical protein
MLNVRGKRLLSLFLIVFALNLKAQDLPFMYADLEPADSSQAIPDDYRYDTGYMYKNLDVNLKQMLIANQNVSNLFMQYRGLQAQSNVVLPKVFQNLVNFSYRYMKAYSKPGTEAQNGVMHDYLSLQIVKAAFCFGNDPFMVLAKIKRESSFNRTLVSSGSAVGFTQMTGFGIKEVQHQMSGNEKLAMPTVRPYFQRAISCFTGNPNYHNFSGNTDDIKKLIRKDWKLDVIYGQILLKTYTAYSIAAASRSRSIEDLVASYRDSFVMYNGDVTEVQGRCMNAKVPMKIEYSCDIINSFHTLENQWMSFTKFNKVNLT